MEGKTILWGDGKTAAALFWAVLIVIFAALALYLFFSAPPVQPRRSHPVCGEVPAAEQGQDRGQ